MKHLILSYSPEEEPYHEWLPEIKDHIVLFVNEDYIDTFNHNHYSAVLPFSNYSQNGNIERIAMSLNEKQPFKQVIAIDELDLIRAAQLRELFGIEGQSIENTVPYRDKLIMKKYIQEEGIPVPEFTLVNSPLDLLLFIENHGFPVIVKPRDSVATIGISMIRDSTELEEWLTNQFQPNMLAEKYIEGKLYHIDGLVSDGEIKFCWPSTYHTLNRKWLNTDFHSSYMLGRDNPVFERLISLTHKVIELLPSPKLFTFHLEVFEKPTGELLICEIASRTGRALVNNTIEHSLGVNLNRSVLRLQCDLPVEINPTLSQLGGWILCKTQVGELVSVPSEIPFDFVVKYQVTGKPGMLYDGSKHCVDSIANMMIVANSEIELQDNILKAQRWFVENTKWK
ncbi:ATP-grasp domain-containing protein [Bacillus sp. FSL R5-0432]|uniref:ATP-grasp domain-containing protein n=1 Tax=unclassified Bacillus (in: firmicutes) TaxID=185979 RepID=UPI000691152B|nr:ATP-grasp domain-containing protein [Bacillus sp. WP8]